MPPSRPDGTAYCLRYSNSLGLTVHARFINVPISGSNRPAGLRTFSTQQCVEHTQPIDLKTKATSAMETSFPRQTNAVLTADNQKTHQYVDSYQSEWWSERIRAV